MDTTAFASRFGPWALITGASEGTGAAFARELAGRGLKLILVARREEPLRALADEISAKGGECVTAAIDLARPGAGERVAAAAAEREVGLFIANAGADTVGANFLHAEAGDWEELVNLNIMTTMRCCHAFAGAMAKRGRGGIVLVGSGACYGGLPGIAAYCGSKAFVLAFAEGLWAELRPHGVDVLNLVLSRTDTPAHRRSLELSGQPIPEGMARPEDVAALGLARLPHGPICNWGEDDDQAGMSATSAADRRARIVGIEAMMRSYVKAEA
ncbi:MAG: SDR family NAD(P)-dependent oxidoreductase [Novosphingobium sp.]